jgi:hypothetical protein
LSLSPVAESDPAFVINRTLLPAMFVDQGHALAVSGKPDEAAGAFERAIEITSGAMTEAPSSVELLRQRARAHSGAGHREAAAADWAALRRRSPLNQRYASERR